MTFDPSTLFSLGEAGGWYDPSDPATLWQDTAGTIAVTTAGQAVARIDDKSGRGNHLTQATAANQPTYQIDSKGKPYLLFDGADDYLSNALALPLPFDRISGIRQISWTLNDRIFYAANGSGALSQNASTPQIRLFDGGTAVALQNGSLAPGANGVVTERHIAAASRLAVNNGAYTSGDAGSTAPTSLVVGATATGTQAANVRIYGMLMRAGSLSDEDVANVRAWMAERCGLSFAVRRKARHSGWL